MFDRGRKKRRSAPPCGPRLHLRRTLLSTVRKFSVTFYACIAVDLKSAKKSVRSPHTCNIRRGRSRYFNPPRQLVGTADARGHQLADQRIIKQSNLVHGYTAIMPQINTSSPVCLSPNLMRMCIIVWDAEALKRS